MVSLYCISRTLCSEMKLREVGLVLLVVLFCFARGDPVVGIAYLKRLNRTRVTNAERILLPLDPEEQGSGSAAAETDCSLAAVQDAVNALRSLSAGCPQRRKYENCCQPKLFSPHRIPPSDLYPLSARNGKTRHVYCDMETDGGGWMVIMRRGSSHPGFKYRWSRGRGSYERGFGKVDRDFWLGLQNMWYFSQGGVELLIELRKTVDGHEERYVARYRTFSLGSKSSGYVLTVGGYDNRTSTLPDSLSHSDGFPFLTPSDGSPDYDTVVADQYVRSGFCNIVFNDYWWHGSRETEACTKVSLLRNVDQPRTSDGTVLIDGAYIIWEVDGFKQGFDYAEMKIRPKTWECGDPSFVYSEQVERQASLSQKYQHLNPFSEN